MAKGDNMDYSKYCCPVCEKAFEKDDDIVVCPECGAPHHRECYETEMHCHYADRHAEGFDYKKESDTEKAKDTETSQSEESHLCPFCKGANPEGSKFCNSCGMPLENNKGYTPYDRHQEENGAPYRNPEENKSDVNSTGNIPPSYSGFVLDPMGGIKPEEEVGEGVTAGEAAKFVKTNTPFYSRLFYHIGKLKRHRFNFAAFIFSGGWILYRKMYKKGALITAILALLLIAQMYVTVFYADVLVELQEIYYGSGGLFMTAETLGEIENFFYGLSLSEIIAFATYYATSVGQLALRIICGIFGNKWYYNHCMKKIRNIKQSAGTKEEADAQLQTKGGVNMGLAVSLAITYILLTLLPYLFIGG